MSTLTYKAAYFNEFITDVNDIKVGEVTAPVELQPNQVRIEVRAASINPVDWKRAKGYVEAFFPTTFPSLIGYDVSGVVVAVGSEVTKFKVGDEIYGNLDAKTSTGSIAEYAVSNEDVLWHKPTSLSFAEAAGLGIAARTAHQALLRAEAGPGKSVFVNAGAGGVGNFVIQFAKNLFKVEKIATTVSTNKVDLAKSLGAIEVVDYTKNDLIKVLKPEYDIAIDNLADIKPVDILKPKNTPRSKFITLVDPGLFEVHESKLKDLEIDHEFFILNSSLKSFDGAINELLDAGKLQVPIDSTHKFTEQGVRNALARLADGHAAGKIIIIVKN
ncbi:hypothetical protein H4219_002178 [Mycoemilia scoparia]|uniref:Enoyl reductase (ER) domain-containing protein n=1 Tax=Mycoemilia scoparia TaxID=417184 RepID=A0A9W8A4R6_9FUNG|nr:hypothetical protein H4219_002178 [Mycoemilia scoparia]